MKKRYILFIMFLFGAQVIMAASSVKIRQCHGDIQVRQGLDETWHVAGPGLELRTIDTILTGENAWVVLELEEGLSFKLGPNAMLDIGDLRKITEQELFLYLTAQKVGRIRPTKEGSIHIENVSVVRGANQNQAIVDRNQNEQNARYMLEMNGARALQQQAYYPNTIIKLYKIKQKFPTSQQPGEIEFYLGKSFEHVNQVGRAIDAYQNALVELEKGEAASPLSTRIRQEATEAISRLKAQ